MEAAKKDSIASHYQGQAGKDYALGRQQDVLHDLGSEIQSRYFTRHLEANMNVLDFGCGNGSVANAIAPSVASIEGLEVNSYTRQIAVEKSHLTVFESLDAIQEDRM